MTPEVFRNRYPEFDSAADHLIEAKLAEAALELDAATYGERYDFVQGLKAALILWDSPLGASMRLDSADAEKRYRQRLAQYRVASVPSIFVT